jgi:hypothetical protein
LFDAGQPWTNAVLVGLNFGRIVAAPNARKEINPLLVKLGFRPGLNFVAGVERHRPVRKLVGGVMVFGDGELAVPPYGDRNRDAAEDRGGLGNP